MKLSGVLLALPLVVVFAAEKPASKKPASEKSKAPAKVVIPPGFGPRVGGASRSQAQAAPPAAKPPAPKSEPRKSGWIKPATDSGPAVTIPAGATEISPGTFRHTDAKGTAWLYSKTPFGITKRREDEAVKEQSKPEKKPARTAGTSTDVTAKDLGGRIQFERVTPFGSTRWERNKSELTEEERAIWEREQKKP